MKASCNLVQDALFPFPARVGPPPVPSRVKKDLNMVRTGGNGLLQGGELQPEERMCFLLLFISYINFQSHSIGLQDI